MTEERWAKPVKSLHISHDLPPDAVNLNVEGRRLAGLTGGFGKMWQKTYWIRLTGAGVSPEDVVAVWKEHFAEFWPKGASFLGPQTAVAAGDVALLNVRKLGSPVVATGILVLYADDTSFSFVSPEGHMFVGMITFSARREGADTVAQIQLFIRAGDPLYELLMAFGGHRMEDNQWKRTLRSLAERFGVDARAEMSRVLIDPKRQWKHFGNIRRSALLRSLWFALRRRLGLHPDGKAQSTRR